MLFNSLQYVLFLPIVFIAYWLIGYLVKDNRKQIIGQNLFLLLASYIFYAWWDWRFLGLLIGMSLISWLAGEFLAKNFAGGGRASSRKIIMWLAILIDIATLGFFKYYNFFVDSFSALFGLEHSIYSLKIVLPLGISFFTFQAISYVVDAYNNKLPLTCSTQGASCSSSAASSNLTNLIDCLLYIGFFPKLLAGPIERPTHLLPQIQQKRVFAYDTAVDGCRQILWGLFKKVVVADNCATYVNAVYADYANQSGSTLLLAAILYTIQIYGDFSGYSDMAIGSAKLLGFKFRDNFLFPYFSRNMGEFWKRWHISLNTWFVDYVYIPLGGSRGTRLSPLTSHLSPEARIKCATIRNTLVIFLLSGLWHGADWSFVAWGGYHGLLLVILILLNRNTKYDHVVAYDRWLPSLKEFGQMLLVFILATIGWMLFRADSIGQFADYTQHMLSASLLTMPDIAGNSFLFLHIALLFLIEWVMRRGKHGLDVSNVKYSFVRYVLYLWVLFDVFAFGGHTENFIYMYF